MQVPECQSLVEVLPWEKTKGVSLLLVGRMGAFLAAKNLVESRCLKKVGGRSFSLLKSAVALAKPYRDL